MDDGEGDFDAAAYLTTVSQLLSEHPIVEASAEDVDHVLQGVLRLLTALLRYRSHLKLGAGAGAGEGGVNLVSHVFDKCLFEMPSAESRSDVPPPQCKNEDTRRCAPLPRPTSRVGLWHTPRTPVTMRCRGTHKFPIAPRPSVALTHNCVWPASETAGTRSHCSPNWREGAQTTTRWCASCCCPITWTAPQPTR